MYREFLVEFSYIKLIPFHYTSQKTYESGVLVKFMENSSVVFVFVFWESSH